jgi:hypothetical protein
MAVTAELILLLTFAVSHLVVEAADPVSISSAKNSPPHTVMQQRTLSAF